MIALIGIILTYLFSIITICFWDYKLKDISAYFNYYYERELSKEDLERIRKKVNSKYSKF